MTDDLWQQVLQKLESEINRQSFNTWFTNTTAQVISDNTIKIKVIDDVASRHIEEYYSEKIKTILFDFKRINFECIFVTDDLKNNEEDKKENIEFSTNNNNFIKQPNKYEKKESLRLNPSYTFENFVIGQNNRLAFAAASAVSKSPAKKYNPLFIYGKPGVGKTHLLHAVGHEILKNMPYKNILYVPSEQFVNEFIFSIMNNTTESFKIKYRNVDILMIDDIQFIEKKEETQNEFFHTFEALHQNDKQIIISSDRPPRELSTLEERLKTRFEWGMITDIQPPNLETREAILQNKARMENITISSDVINYIARRIKSSIRALESALTRLKMISEVYNEPITIHHAQNNLKDIFDNDTSKKLTVEDIMANIAEKENVTVEQLKSKSRQSRIVKPRFISMYLSRKLTNLTTTDIGAKFGGRDHSTVVNAINKIENDIHKNTELKEYLDYLVDELKG